MTLQSPQPGLAEAVLHTVRSRWDALDASAASAAASGNYAAAVEAGRQFARLRDDRHALLRHQVMEQLRTPQDTAPSTDTCSACGGALPCRQVQDLAHRYGLLT